MMPMEQYGFVYIWRDRRTKRLYIGCHWGAEDDGYVCSSKEMRSEYSIRPRDFSRKVVQRIYGGRKELIEAEHRWLQLIPDCHLGNKFYNKSKHLFNHWTANENMAEVKAVIARSVKAANSRNNAAKNKARSQKMRSAATPAVEFYLANAENFTIRQVANQFGITYSILRKVLSESGHTKSGARFKKGTGAHLFMDALTRESIASLSCRDAAAVLGISANSVAVYRRELGIKRTR